MKAFLDTGFLLTILTHRRGAESAWALLRECEIPAGVSSLQLLFARHGLTKSLTDPKGPEELRQVCASGLKLLKWLIQQEVIRPAEINYEEAVAMAEQWGTKLRDPVPTLLLVWAGCAVVSGAKQFLSFDPRTRALVKSAGLKVAPEKL